jgi:hypothetical protein
MDSSSIMVRPLASPAEHQLHFQFADQAFSPDPSPTSAQYWQQVTTSRPGYRSEQLRGAFRNIVRLCGHAFSHKALWQSRSGTDLNVMHLGPLIPGHQRALAQQ